MEGCGRQTSFVQPTANLNCVLSYEGQVSRTQLQVARSNCFNLTQCKLHVFDKVKSYPERRQKPMRNLKQFRKPRCIPNLFQTQGNGLQENKIRAASSRYFYRNSIPPESGYSSFQRSDTAPHTMPPVIQFCSFLSEFSASRDSTETAPPHF